MTIGSQQKTIFGSKVVVKIGTDTLGMADRYMARWGYGVVRRPLFGANIPAYLTASLFGELRVEGLYTTDNAVASYATPSAGDLPIKTVTIEETDTQATPVKKTWTFTGRLSPFEKEGQADQFSIFRFTLELNAEPTVA
mgnify:CR=1 FL=1